MSYARVIVNPAAGAGRTAKKWPQIKGLLKSVGVRFEELLTEAPGHAIELAKSAAQEGYELVVSVGGDGTLNEIVNGLYSSGNIGNVMIGIISTGTGSDYIRTISVPRNYKEACQRLTNPNKLVVDLGVVEYAGNGGMVKRLFVNFAGLGFDAEVVKATTQRFKALGRVGSYLMGLLATFLFYKNAEVSRRLDGKTVNGKVCSVVISNGRYGGGGMLVAPRANPTDGFLDMMIISDVSKPDLLWSLPRVYRGTHLSHHKVTASIIREVETRSKHQIALQADGELLGETMVARFYVIPAALTVVI